MQLLEAFVVLSSLFCAVVSFLYYMLSVIFPDVAAFVVNLVVNIFVISSLAESVDKRKKRSKTETKETSNWKVRET